MKTYLDNDISNFPNKHKTCIGREKYKYSRINPWNINRYKRYNNKLDSDGWKIYPTKSHKTTRTKQNKKSQQSEYRQIGHLDSSGAKGVLAEDTLVSDCPVYRDPGASSGTRKSKERHTIRRHDRVFPGVSPIQTGTLVARSRDRAGALWAKPIV